MNFAPLRDRSRSTTSLPVPASGSIPASRPVPEVTPMYDPMVAKLIVWDKDREAATRRMLRALDEYEIAPLSTPDPVPQDDPPDRAVGPWRDLGPDRRQEVAEDHRPRGHFDPEPADGEGQKVARDYLVEGFRQTL